MFRNERRSGSRNCDTDIYSRLYILYSADDALRAISSALFRCIQTQAGGIDMRINEVFLSASHVSRAPEGVDSFFYFIKNGSLGPAGKISPQVLLAAFAYDFPEGNIEAEIMARMAKLMGPTGLEASDICLPVDPYKIADVIPVFKVNDVDFKNSSLEGAVILNNVGQNDDAIAGASFLVKADEPEYRRKYILAHMMGHYFTNHFSSFIGTRIFQGKPRFVENDRTLGYGMHSDSREYEADIFALDLMVPQKVLGEIMDDGSYSVPDMLEIFGAPLDMIQRQAKRMGRKLPCFGTVDADIKLDYLSVDI